MLVFLPSLLVHFIPQRSDMLLSKEIVISDKISLLNFEHCADVIDSRNSLNLALPYLVAKKHVCCIHLLFPPSFSAKSFLLSGRSVVLQRVRIIVIRKIKTCLRPSTISNLNNDVPVVKSTE
jgi:hypothetical protein